MANIPINVTIVPCDSGGAGGSDKYLIIIPSCIHVVIGAYY